MIMKEDAPNIPTKLNNIRIKNGIRELNGKESLWLKTVRMQNNISPNDYNHFKFLKNHKSYIYPYPNQFVDIKSIQYFILPVITKK